MNPIAYLTPAEGRDAAGRVNLNIDYPASRTTCTFEGMRRKQARRIGLLLATSASNTRLENFHN